MFSTHFSSSAVSLLFLFVYSTVCLPYSTATILPAFSDFLSTAYGEKSKNQSPAGISVDRAALGTKMSLFTRKWPIIIVHGCKLSQQRNNWN
ncbi:hypothetical protein niasHT_009196 [Heterodera trifolii]|uniref:Secreted protein n=1 Tax=Heterodera trifolii TaxID=157864 RepID=A0ABD2LZ00_9BILA